MKKTLHIHLVLISAALASCNQYMAPPTVAPFSPPDRDSTWQNQVPDPGYYPWLDGFNTCCMPVNVQLWNYALGSVGYPYALPYVNGYYLPGFLYRKSSFWHNGHFVVRGGWGKNGRLGLANS